MTMLWFCMIYFWGHTVYVASQGIYKVTAPKVIRPNTDYHAVVSLQGASVLTTYFDVIIEGIRNDGQRYRTEETVKVAPYSSEIATLKVGDILPGNYSLLLAGRSGFKLYDSVPLIYSPKTYSVLIQTDRAVYNSGNRILFRALILNSQLRPVADLKQKRFDVFITDGDGNRIKEWNSVVAPKGVFTEEVLVSNNPVLGNWHISVRIEGQIYNKTIEVAQYILPKFIVNIQAPKYVTFKENTLTAHIQSFYNYGKKVRGDATVTVYPTIVSGVIQPIFQNPIRKVIPIDGSASVDFDIANDLRLSDEYERTVIVDVTIEEAHTGRRQNNSVEVHIRKYPYKIEIIKTSDYYKPGLRYTAFIKISNQDGTPVQDKTNPVKVKYGFSRVGEVYTEKEYTLDSKGLVKIELDTPPKASNKTALRIEAEYLELKERMPPVPSAVSPSNTYLQVSLLTDKITVNTGAMVLLNCTEPMKHISYEIISRGDIVTAHSHDIQNRKEFNFHFTASHAMVPVSHLIVNYVREDGELVADSIDIQVDGLLQNSIDVQLSRPDAAPDSEIDVTIRAEPNSYIGLLAIDQNIADLRSGYDITHDMVFKELLGYDPSNLSPYWAVLKDIMSHFYWKPGGGNAKDIYHDSGAVLLTNGLVSEYRPTLEDIYLRPVFYEGSTVKPDTGVGLPLPSATRPPLAGPYAFSRIPKPVWNNPKVYLQSNVADTWLFTNFSSGFEGKASIHRKIPSSITTWLVTGFSLDSAYGLGIVKAPKRLQVAKSFSVNFDIPHSVQRLETLSIPVVVYNNMANDMPVEITLHNIENNFEFTRPLSESNDTKKVELYKKKKLTVLGNSAMSTSFMITPTKIGLTEIKITAGGVGGQDTSIKNLWVKAEGETQYYTKTLFIDLRNKRDFDGNLTIDIPKNFVPNSKSIEVSVVGDILGHTMINLENLIRLPTGCGEQNFVHLMPDVIILKYLRNSGQLTPTIETQAIKNLELGYQTQLAYRRNDGSFSAFGKRDDVGSIWITAYTVLVLTKAKEFIYVDEEIIQKALQWLNEKKYADGSFFETGPIIHHEIQSNPLALTAFVLLAFIEAKGQNKAYLEIMGRGLDYVGRNIDENNDAHTLAVCSYVLKQALHPRARIAFNYLDLKAKSDGNMKWWAKDVPELKNNNPWNRLPKSIDIETTAYGLLTFIESGRLEDAIPVINWLVGQESDLGAFTSSHDTVLGLYAIYKLVSKLSVKPSVEIQYSFNKNVIGRFKINENSAMIVQKASMPNNVDKINITAQGSGVALFRVTYKYNVNVTGPWPLFTLDPQVDKNSNANHLQLSICTGFVSPNLTQNQESNMAVMEVTLPSGFTADVDSLPSLEVSQNVQKVQTKNEDTTVILYFNNLTTTEYCPTVSAYRTHKVAYQKPVPVIVYDYYDSTRRARVFYKGTTSTFCGVCEDDCDKYCTSSEQRTGNDNENDNDSTRGSTQSSVSTNNIPQIALIFILTLLLIKDI
ncbi:CD109 antigen-like isoform X2 [Agrilus planipennis]|nr:CD109 antigen-like isoform X2 [Agrilus planipennis]